jgi:hypothetical protein
MYIIFVIARPSMAPEADLPLLWLSHAPINTTFVPTQHVHGEAPEALSLVLILGVASNAIFTV